MSRPRAHCPQLVCQCWYAGALVPSDCDATLWLLRDTVVLRPYSTEVFVYRVRLCASRFIC